MCVGASTRDGLLLLHVRVTVACLRSHGEGGGLGHAGVEFVLQVISASSRVVVLFVHVDVVTTSVHGGFRSGADLRRDVVVGRGRVFDNRLRCDIRPGLTSESPRGSLVLSAEVTFVLARGCLEELLLLSGQVYALTSAHSPSRLLLGERQFRITIVRSWARLIRLLLTVRLELQSGGHCLRRAVHSEDCLSCISTRPRDTHSG